jgi:PhnB protein
MYVTPYLFFNGNCAEALRYYEKALGARVLHSTTYGDTPAKDHVPPALHDKVIHATLMVGNTAVMASDDCTPDGAAVTPGGYSLTVSVDTPETAKKVFDALADGGTVTMALDKTFFAAAFGSVHDRYGVRWMVICEKVLG